MGNDWRLELLKEAERIKEESAQIIEQESHPLIARKAKLIRACVIKFSDDPKMITATGIANWKTKEILLSEYFFKKPENVQLEFRETVLHELCHIACPGAGHNKTWQQLNTAIGGNGAIYHEL